MKRRPTRPFCLGLLLLGLAVGAPAPASAKPERAAFSRSKRELAPLLDEARHAKAYQRLQRRLRATRISVDYRRGVALADVLAELRQRTKLRVQVLREAQPLLAKTKIRLRLKQVRLASLLELIAVQSGEGVRFGYRHGVLWFGLLPEEHGQPVVMRFYESATASYSPPDAPKGEPKLELQVKPQRAAERAKAEAKPELEDDDCGGCCECGGGGA